MSKTLIVLSIFGIFLLWKFVLFPEKLEFTDKVKVFQGLTLAKDYKSAVAFYWKKNQAFPSAEQWKESGVNIAVDFSESIVSKIVVAEDSPGTITVYFTDARHPELAAGIAGKSLTLSPHVLTDTVEWSCKGNVPVEFLPRPCK